jgi:hypothetical protein
VPFTLSHGAAALPFRRFRVVFSGVLIGTFAPDFEYFLRLGPVGHFGHTLAGVFVFTLPAALVALWLYHDVIKLPVAKLMPDGIQRRLVNHLQEFRFRGAARFALIAGSVLLGIATHVTWDAFTHAKTWPYRHWALLRQSVRLPVVGLYPFDRVLQHASTLFGMAVLCIWLAFWYRATAPSPQAIDDAIPPRRKIAIGVAVMSAAFIGATIRVILGGGNPAHVLASKHLLGQFVITFMAAVWWELVAYGVWTLHANSPTITANLSGLRAREEN